nr:hypothetical protein HK105_006690 [Polyrhizophydium stewartii]
MAAVALTGAVAMRSATVSGGKEDSDAKAARATLADAIAAMHSPYLRALFSIASSTNGVLEAIEDTTMPIADRMTIALRFLDDEALLPYIQRQQLKMLAEGQIDGLLLTGLDKDGVDLIERYVNRTGDIQTASLVISLCGCDDTQDDRTYAWVEECVWTVLAA